MNRLPLTYACDHRGAWVRIPPEAALLSLSTGRSEPVSGGVVVLPCFVLNRSHRFNHVHCSRLMIPAVLYKMM